MEIALIFRNGDKQSIDLYQTNMICYLMSHKHYLLSKKNLLQVDNKFAAGTLDNITVTVSL